MCRKGNINHIEMRDEKMKKWLTLISIVFVFAFVTACGNQNNNHNDDNNVNNQNNNNNYVNEENDTSTVNSTENTDQNDGTNNHVETANNQEDMQKMVDQLDFYEIELEVSYGHDQEYELEIEHHRNGDVEAKIEDELNNVEIDDDLEAFNHIYPHVKNLSISKDMEKQDVIDAVLQAFDLDADYEKFEVEFEFEDQTKISFEDRK